MIVCKGVELGFAVGARVCVFVSAALLFRGGRYQSNSQWYVRDVLLLYEVRG